MSVLEHPPSVDVSVDVSNGPALAEFEDAFRSWALDLSKPDEVLVGTHGRFTMVEIVHRLEDSRGSLSASECLQIGLAPGVAVGDAASELRYATVDPDGPRCRSFRAATYYLRGLTRLDGGVRCDGRGRCTCDHMTADSRS